MGHQVFLCVVKWYHSAFGTQERKFDSYHRDQLVCLGSLMVERRLYMANMGVRFSNEVPCVISSTDRIRVFETQDGGSIPSWRTKFMESNAAGLVLRPALKTGFSEMGWGSTPLLSAKL